MLILQRVLKMGYFYWFHVENSNHLHTELSLGYPKDPKFYLESKTSFIDISSIASFKLFLIAWLRDYCTFSESSLVSLKSWPLPKYIQYRTISKKKFVNSTIKLFFFLKYVVYETVLSKYLNKKSGVTVLV